LLPWNPERIDTDRAFVELLLIVVLTLSLLVLRPLSGTLTRSILWKPMSALGAVSYSLYLIHQFNLHLVNLVAQIILPVGTPQVFAGAVVLALHVALASVFWYFCERPFMRTV
jgi:peptidoglycan/LPS O-acetylase OafA/YrhL